MFDGVIDVEHRLGLWELVYEPDDVVRESCGLVEGKAFRRCQDGSRDGGHQLPIIHPIIRTLHSP